MTIRHVIAAAACALGLAACSSSNADLWVPSWTAFGVKPTTVSVTIESEPAGAEARTTQGLTCLTPCTLSVPPTEEFSISYTLAGYVPQSVSVRPVETEPSKFGPPPVPGLTPNPVMAQLKPVADVAVPAQRKKKQRPAATATAAPAAPRVSRAATAPPAAPPNASPTATIAPRAPAAAAAPPAAPGCALVQCGADGVRGSRRTGSYARSGSGTARVLGARFTRSAGRHVHPNSRHYPMIRRSGAAPGRRWPA